MFFNFQKEINMAEASTAGMERMNAQLASGGEAPRPVALRRTRSSAVDTPPKEPPNGDREGRGKRKSKKGEAGSSGGEAKQEEDSRLPTALAARVSASKIPEGMEAFTTLDDMLDEKFSTAPDSIREHLTSPSDEGGGSSNWFASKSDIRNVTAGQVLVLRNKIKKEDIHLCGVGSHKISGSEIESKELTFAKGGFTRLSVSSAPLDEGILFVEPGYICTVTFGFAAVSPVIVGPGFYYVDMDQLGEFEVDLMNCRDLSPGMVYRITSREACYLAPEGDHFIFSDGTVETVPAGHDSISSAKRPVLTLPGVVCQFGDVFDDFNISGVDISTRLNLTYTITDPRKLRPFFSLVTASVVTSPPDGEAPDQGEAASSERSDHFVGEDSHGWTEASLQSDSPRTAANLNWVIKEQLVVVLGCLYQAMSGPGKELKKPETWGAYQGFLLDARTRLKKELLRALESALGEVGITLSEVASHLELSDTASAECKEIREHEKKLGEQGRKHQLDAAEQAHGREMDRLDAESRAAIEKILPKDQDKKHEVELAEAGNNATRVTFLPSESGAALLNGIFARPSSGRLPPAVVVDDKPHDQDKDQAKGPAA